MKQKNKKKYLLFIPIIVIVILLFSTIYFIDLMKFNKNHKDYDETYMIKMMYLVADEKITSKEDTISDVADYDNDKALTLKRLPIIKSIKETLDNMSNCDRTSEDYINYIKLLSSLNETYKEIKEV